MIKNLIAAIVCLFSLSSIANAQWTVDIKPWLGDGIVHDWGDKTDDDFFEYWVDWVSFEVDYTIPAGETGEIKVYKSGETEEFVSWTGLSGTGTVQWIESEEFEDTLHNWTSYTLDAELIDEAPMGGVEDGDSHTFSHPTEVWDIAIISTSATHKTSILGDYDEITTVFDIIFPHDKKADVKYYIDDPSYQNWEGLELTVPRRFTITKTTNPHVGGIVPHDANGYAIKAKLFEYLQWATAKDTDTGSTGEPEGEP